MAMIIVPVKTLPCAGGNELTNAYNMLSNLDINIELSAELGIQNNVAL